MFERDPSRNKLTAIVLALSGHYIGYYLPIFNSLAVPILEMYYGLSPEESLRVQGNLNFLYCLGGTIGVCLIGVAVNRFGRIQMTMALDISTLIVGMLSTFNSLTILQIARFLSGFITGMHNMISGLILVELFPSELAGFGNLFICLVSGTFSFITFIQQSMFSYETLEKYWRLFLSWPLIIGVFRFLYLFLYLRIMTPKYICLKYRDSPELENFIKASYLNIYTEEGIDDKIKSTIEQFDADSGKDEESISTLFSAKYIHQTWTCFLLKVWEQLTGISFLMFFSTHYFNKVSGNGKFVSTVMGISNIAGSCVGMYIVNKFRRVPAMKFGVLMQGLSLLGIYLCALVKLNFLMPVLIVVYTVTYMAGLGGLNGLYITELLPAHGLGLSIGVGWFFYALVGKLSNFGVELMGENNTMIMYAISCLGLQWFIGRFCVERGEEKREEVLKPLVPIETV